MSDKSRYRNPVNGAEQELTPAVAAIFGYELIEDSEETSTPIDPESDLPAFTPESLAPAFDAESAKG